jgi:hypothetical protein
MDDLTDFLWQMEILVLEEAPFHEVPPGSIDDPTGSARHHGPWPASTCAAILKLWYRTGWIWALLPGSACRLERHPGAVAEQPGRRRGLGCPGRGGPSRSAGTLDPRTRRRPCPAVPDRGRRDNATAPVVRTRHRGGPEPSAQAVRGSRARSGPGIWSMRIGRPSVDVAFDRSGAGGHAQPRGLFGRGDPLSDTSAVADDSSCRRNSGPVQQRIAALGSGRPAPAVGG